MIMANLRYDVEYDYTDGRYGWEHYTVLSEDNYAEMIHNIKFALQQCGGGTATIYLDGEYIDEVSACGTAPVRYEVGDTVSFLLDETLYIGTIDIVDAFGTFFDNSEPYYDIYVNIQEKRVLVKHVRQSCIRGKAA